MDEPLPIESSLGELAAILIAARGVKLVEPALIFPTRCADMDALPRQAGSSGLNGSAVKWHGADLAYDVDLLKAGEEAGDVRLPHQNRQRAVAGLAVLAAGGFPCAADSSDSPSLGHFETGQWCPEVCRSVQPPS